MAAAVKNFGAALADSVNPFVRLVITATTDDGVAGIPYFQSEKVKEAAGQSEYGCECVWKALQQRLESKSTVVQHKSLALIRTLMLEGPQGFGTKVSMNQTRFFTLAQVTDVRRDSLEAQVKQMAQNILDACNGKPGALLRPVGDSDVNNNIAGANNMSNARAKSDFQEAQERELKAFKKKREEEKKAQEILTLEKHFETYDHTLSAPKLVASAVQTTKKKLATEELCNFHEATAKHVKPSDVMAALDACLKDIKEPVQNKYKALCLVEHMTLNAPYHDAIVYFKTNVNGIVRVSQIQAGPDAPKLQQMVQTAQTLLRYLATCGVPAPLLPGESVPRVVGMPHLVACPTPAAVPAQRQSAQPVVGAANINPAFMTAPSFNDMEVRQPRPRAQSGNQGSLPPPQQQNLWGAPPQQQQPFGAPQQQAFGVPQQQQQQQAFNNGGQPFAAPPQQQTWGAPTTQTQWGQPQQAPPQQPQQHADPNDALRLMQEQMQQQMLMMQQQMAQLNGNLSAQPAPAQSFVPPPTATAASSRSESVNSGFGTTVPTTATAAPAWSSSVAAPPPLPDDEPRGRSGSTFSDTHSSMPTSVPNNTMVTVPNGSFSTSVTSDMRSPGQPPAPSSSLASAPDTMQFRPPVLQPATTPSVAIPKQTVTLEMLQQLQAQMAETQAILAKQQAMYSRMQAQFMEQQRAQMAAFEQLQMH